MEILRQFDRLRHHARRPLARTPYLWDAAMVTRPGKRATLARQDTALVLDGFLRSGNTFSVAAFTVANGSHHHVGRHLHAGPHILRAVRLGLPTVVLIRQPAEAVSSYLVRRPTLTPDDALVEYLDFYRTAWKARFGFVVGLFDQVIRDFGVIIAAVNLRFGTSYRSYEATLENQAAAFEIVEQMNRLECRGHIIETHVGRPSTQRQKSKDDVRELLQRPRSQALLQAADQVYDLYAELAIASRSYDGPGGAPTVKRPDQ